MIATLLLLAVNGADAALVPWPRSITPGVGAMTPARIVTRDPRLLPLAEVVAEEMRRAAGLSLPVEGGPARDGDIVLSLGGGLSGEAHRVTVAATARVEGGTYGAVALGTTTLVQLLRDGKLPRGTVDDAPAFPYRGALLDLARKPYSLATLRRCVTACRFYKIRYLHLHLTDENAWVFPSTAYPELGSQNFAWAGGHAPKPYPLDGLKALVAFADRLGVTLVPEIEMPGHSGQLRGTLPGVFGYKGKDGKTLTPGYINMVSEDAFKALDTILGEVASVFRSSPYIHIGCDEVSLGGIETLPEVLAFVKKHGLKSPHDVFSHFVARMHGIVKRHGKRMIVWEGAPLGPATLPKDVVFMPWVGGSGFAGELVKRGHTVINAPWGVKEAYFDPHDANGARLKDGEPLLLGATSILWESPEEAALPYLRNVGALRNEPTYNPRARRGHADWLVRHRAADAVLDRLLTGVSVEASGVHSPLVYMRPDRTFTDRATVSLVSKLPGEIRYTFDGGPEKVYRGPITLDRTTAVRARVAGLDVLERTFHKVPGLRHDAVGAKVTITPEKPGYPGPGAKGLADGLLSDGDETGSAGWVGWERRGRPVEVVLEMPKAVRVTRAAAHFLRSSGGVALPARAEFAVSLDGKRWRDIGAVIEKDGARARGWYLVKTEAAEAKFVRLRATHGGDWVFLDEVTVNADAPGPTLAHAARGLAVKLAHPPSPSYATGDLTDGHVARSAEFLSTQWLGWEGKDMDAAIDLGGVKPIREVGVRFLHHVRAGIFVPGRMEVFVSDDGKKWRTAGTAGHKPDARPAYQRTLSVKLEGEKARHVRVVAKTNGMWIFADEVFVNP